MSILNVNKINPVGGGSTITIAGIASVTNAVSVANSVTASAFYGDGSQLSNVTSTTINNNADNRVITGSGTANTLEGEANLTFNGGATGDAQLTVHAAQNDSGADSELILETSNDFATSAMMFKDSTAEAGSVAYNHGDNYIKLSTNGTNGGTERFRIGPTGQFGIGSNYGTAGQVLTSGGASAAPTWGGAGKVLQVKYKRGGVTTSSNSGGWTDSVESGLNVDITPTSSTSFIIVQMHSVGGNTSSGRSYFLRLRRKINNAGDTGVASFQIGDGNNGGIQSLALTHVEVPNNWNTSHAINYRIRFGQDGSGTARFDYATTSVLYAMEVQP